VSIVKVLGLIGMKQSLRLSCIKKPAALPPAWGCELQQVTPVHAEWAFLDPMAAQDPQTPGCLACEEGNIFFSEEEQAFGKRLQGGNRRNSER
jgi:hypothetical protein